MSNYRSIPDSDQSPEWLKWAREIQALSQTGAQALSQTGGHPEAHRPTAGKTQVIDQPMAPPHTPPPPMATLPDHEVPPAVSAPAASAPAAMRRASKAGPPKTLVWMLLIVAAGIVGLLVAIGAVALYLFL